MYAWFATKMMGLDQWFGGGFESYIFTAEDNKWEKSMNNKE